MTAESGGPDGGQSPSTPSRLDKLEQATKIFATAAIPVIVAIGGWVIQSSIEHDKERAAKLQQEQQTALDKDKLSLEYVKIAKDILTSTEPNIPTELTTWSWKLLDGVSPVKFDKKDLDRLIAGKERIPLTPSSSRLDFLSLAPEYELLFSRMKVVPTPALDVAVESIVKNKERYSTVERSTGVPWYVVAVAHQDYGFDFTKYLGNGDPLDAATVNVPRGRGPFPSWEEGARDALQLVHLTEVQDWSTARILFEMEKYNGFGYRRRQMNSPYVWNCTSHYTKGRFVTDRHFDPEAVPDKCGGAAILKRLIDRREVVLK